MRREPLPGQRATALSCPTRRVRVVLCHDEVDYGREVPGFFDRHLRCGGDDDAGDGSDPLAGRRRADEEST